MLLLSLGYHFTPQFRLSAGLTYTNNESGFGSVNYAAVSPAAQAALVDTGKYSYDHSMIYDLSNLKINTYGLSLGAEYDINEFFGVTADFSYEKWGDDEWYLVDDTGDFFMGTFGLLFSF